MEFIKELLMPKRFNTLSHLVVISWVTCGVILLGIFADMEANEQSSFHCDITSENRKEYIQGQCLRHFHIRYSGGLPFYCFVIINFVLIGIVSVIYSQFVKSSIDELNQAANLEAPSHSNASRRLFITYCCQLGARFLLGILFIILQTQVLHPSNFPKRYDCSLSEPRVTENDHLPGTNDTRNSTETYKCHILQATVKAFWAFALLAVNGFFAVLVLTEITYVIVKANIDRNFAQNKTFYEMHLLGKKGKPFSFHLFVENTKKRIIRDTENMQPLLPLNPGENKKSSALKVDEIYTSLIVHSGRKNYSFWGERHDIFQEYLGPETTCDHERVNKVMDIFAPSKESLHEVPLHILVIGRPGIGKSLLCQKIIRDWANGRLLNEASPVEKNFDFVVLFKFRWFNSSERMSLRDSFSHTAHSESLDHDVFHHICQNPEKLLLIFDGLDELKDHSRMNEEENYADGTSEEMPFSALYGKLASGKLLPGASVLTTTRATALPSVAHLVFHKVVEILGFTNEQVQEYVQRFMTDERSAGLQIWRHISSNANLMSLCYIPVNCFIICSYLKELLKMRRDASHDRNGIANLPTTLTDIYRGVVKMFVLKHNLEYRNRLPTEEEFLSDGFPVSVQEVLTKLGEVALKGTKEGRLIFYANEVRGLEESGLIHRLPNQQTAPFKYRAQFCFVHLTVQEYFAANELLRSTGLEELRRFVARHVDEGRWQLVMQFAAGLLRICQEPRMSIFTGFLPTSSEHRDNSDLTWWPIRSEKELALTLCKCLFEYHEWTPAIAHSTAAIEEKGVNMSMLSLYSTDSTAIVHVLKHLKTIPWIDLSFNSFGSLGCVEIAKLLLVGNLSKLSTICSHITDEGVQHLSLALAQARCKLKWLNLSVNPITDTGVKHLCDALSKAQCGLTGLVLNTIGWTEVGVKYLADTLSKDECKLTELHVSSDGITDESAKRLSDALSQSGCKLAKLSLSTNEITDSGVKHLSEAISHKECKLVKLDLSDNGITDAGAKYLSDAASQIDCQLVKACLGRNAITDVGVKHLSDALSLTGCRLTKLNLKHNQITDAGAKHLSDTLSKRESNLTKLDLSYNQITDVGGMYLANALSLSNGSMTKLDLSGNQISKDVQCEVIIALSKSRVDAF